MKPRPIDAIRSKVLVARQYLERGFIDTAMRLFVQNEAGVEEGDWMVLAERLMERHRIADVVRVCELGGVPLPRERLLALGDEQLQRKDVEGAIRFYALVDADVERWARVVDLLTARPDQELRAIEVAARYLVGEPTAESTAS